MNNSICNMMDLSTSHIPSESPDWGDDIRVIDHDFGWIIFIFNLSDDELSGTVPEWLRPIWIEAVREDCILINFDRDSDTDPKFRIWHW